MLIKHFVCLAVPPVADITKGVKEACSTSRTLNSYVLNFSFSCFKYVLVREVDLLESCIGVEDPNIQKHSLNSSTPEAIHSYI